MKKFLKRWAGFVAVMCASTLLCAGATFSTQSTADAFVTPGADGSLSVSNFGGAGALAIAAGNLPQGAFQSVLKFDLSGAASSFNAQFGAGQWSVQSVTLELSASPHNNAIFNNVAAGQFGVSLMQNNTWVEGTGNGGVPTSDGISYTSLLNTYINNTTDQALGTFNFGGNTSGQDSYSLNLSSGLQGDVVSGNNLSLRLFAADDVVSYLFSSRSGASASRPTILIDAEPVPEPSSAALCMGALAVFGLAQRFRKGAGRAR